MRRLTHYSRFAEELPSLGSFVTTRDGHYGEVIGHEEGQMRLQFSGSIQGLYYADEVTVTAEVKPLAATCPDCGDKDINLKQTGICSNCGHLDKDWVPLDEPRTAKWITGGAPLTLAAHDYPELQDVLSQPPITVAKTAAAYTSPAVSAEKEDKAELPAEANAIEENAAKEAAANDGFGAGKCPSCGSKNTDSSRHWPDDDGVTSFDCMDCGHGWDKADRGKKTSAVTHLTHEGYYAGVPICGGSKQPGDAGAHCTYAPDSFFKAGATDPQTGNAICPACQKAWNEVG